MDGTKSFIYIAQRILTCYVSIQQGYSYDNNNDIMTINIYHDQHRPSIMINIYHLSRSTSIIYHDQHLSSITINNYHLITVNDYLNGLPHRM